MSDSEDVIRTETGAPILSPWPVLVGLAVGVAAFPSSIHALPHDWRLAAFPLTIVAGFAAGGITDWVERKRGGVPVEISARAIRIGSRSMTPRDALEVFRRRRLEDPHAFTMVRVIVAREQAGCEAVPVRDLHALVSYIAKEGLRIELEKSAWALVAHGARSETPGPDVKLRVAAGRVVHGALEGAPGIVGGYAPDVRAQADAAARVYRVPTRFVRPAQGRAYLDPQWEHASIVTKT